MHMVDFAAVMRGRHATRCGRMRTGDGCRAIERCRNARRHVHPFPPRSRRTLGRSNPGRMVMLSLLMTGAKPPRGIGADQASKKQRKSDESRVRDARGSSGIAVEGDGVRAEQIAFPGGLIINEAPV